MRMPSGLSKLDDRVLGKKKGTARPADDTRDRDGDRDSRDADSRPERTEKVERTTSSEQPDRPKRGNGDGLPTLLATVWRISRLVFLALAAVLVLAIACIYLPTNENNDIVSNVLSLGETIAGPFKDVFTDDDPDRVRTYNYGLAAGVYVLVGTIVAKLPTGSKRKG